ncbi:hypothetical protein ACQ4PT_071448 [Festuca glaucescens]
MDKSWMVEDRHTEKYINGVKGFIQFAFSHSAKGNTILCPCKKCLNCSWLEASHVLEHLVCEGFVNGYRRWEYHGEASSSLESGRDAHVQQFDEVEENDDLEEDCDELAGMMRDMRHDFGDLSDVEDEGDCREPTNESDPFKQLVGDAEEQLYPGCTCFSKLRFVVRLLHIKSLGGWSDKSFNMLLELQKEAFPKGSKLPKNFHEAKKMIRCLRLDYVSIHACDNDCILFWKEHANADCCPKCKASRWKSQKKRPDGRAAHKVPVKVLRYFPIAKRLQRLFISAKSATDCRWHDEGRTKDGLLRHPADSPAWKHFDAIHTRFAEDSRNIRLIIATDGFNPYRSMNCAYSVWPVIAIPINLPPWVCMKQPNFILTLLIPGPKSPGRDIDVFLEPLIDDLHLLFEKGVRTYDASMSQHFQLHAAVHSTITDLPGLATLVGVVTSGEYGCPKCHLLTCSRWLTNGKKTCYMDHRRFFKKIYAPVIRISDMEKLEEEIAETLSILETIFLPSFFDMMVHLMVHLPLQVRLGGPVKYSNMFPIERFLCTLKGYVRTKSHPEGSIAEGYIFYECLNFCARYFERCETRISRLVRNDDPEPMSSSMPFFNGGGRYLAGKYTITLDRNAWLQAHRYVLFNYDNITPYLSKHLEYLSSTGQRNALQIDKIHHDEFHEWLRLHVAHLVDSGKRMAREEGSSEEARTYGDVCEEQVARNTEKMKSLGLAVISSEMKALKKAAGKPKKKRALEVAIPESTRVLRSQSVMHESDNEEDADNEQELEENEELGLDDQQKKKKDGRKRTRMHTVYDRGNQPPVPVSFNEKGQPNGDNASEFSNFIATLVKTHIPLGHEDWRLVPVEKKNALLTTLRKYYVVDDKLKDYVMGTSHKKWRDFKADLKKKFFKPEKTDEEILTLRVEDNRVSYDDCVWLIKFWRSEEAEKRSEQGKKNRSSQKVLHTSGSKSHARVAAEMHKEKGYAPRRDEVFVRTHISKRDETTMTAETSKVIKDIDTAIEEHPELLEKSIQQGDILSHVLGKERNGYVRCVGLGPTAGSLGIPGAQKLKSTKLQMAELEAEKAWRTNEALMDHMDYFKEDTKAQMDALMAEMAEMRSMLSQSIAGNKNFMHTSEIQPEASVGEYSTADQSIHDVDSIAQLIRKKKEAAQRLNNEAELQKRKEAELLHKKKEEALMQKNNEQDMQKKREIESKKKQEDLMQKKKEQDMQKKREADLKKKKEATVTQKNHQKGNEVILFNVYRDHTTPVAKATILATDRKKIVGGRELGTECCEVVVNYIIKRDAILPRPIGDVTTMGQAQGRTIAWLYKHLEVDKSKMKQASPPQEE